MKKTLKFAIILFLLVSSLSANKIRPEWTINHPINNDFYIGIGISSKNIKNKDYIKKAKDNALRGLSSEIIVNISSEVINKMVEKSGIVKEEFESQIQTSTQAELEGFELIDIWENENEYWVYYRLSKEFYETEKQKKIQKVISLSLDIFSKAKFNEKNNDIEKALLYYIQSLNPITKYMLEPLETQYEGEKIFLSNEIYSSLQSLLSEIELKPKVNKQKATIGKPLKKPLEVLAIYNTENNVSTKISNLPLKFSFLKGSGEIISNVRTDRNGVGKCNINKITSPDKIQIVFCELDIDNYITQDTISVIYNIIKGFPIPNTKFILNVAGLSIFVESNELNLGRKNEIPYIEPHLKETLSEKGFVFVDDITKADFLIEIDAKSRKGSTFNKICFSYVDLTASIVNMNSGEEIYKNTLSNVKGGDLNFNKAGLKALKKAASKISDEIQNVIINKM